MIHVTEHGLDDAVQRLSNFNSGRLQRALTQAVRRALKAAKTDAGQRVAARYTIATGKVTRSIKIKASGLSGSMTSSGGRNPLPFFILRPKRRLKHPPRGGLYAQVVHGQGGMLSRAFVWKARVFERVGRPRLPIRQLTSVSNPGMLSHSAVSRFIVDNMRRRSLDEISRALEWLF